MGRNKKFNTIEEMQILIDEYFKIKSERTKIKFTKDGQILKVPDPAPVHITGLCEHLMLTNETLLQYEKDPIFSESIKAARQKCEAYAVDCLFEGRPGNKADFVLKNNFKWKDHKEISHEGTDKPIKFYVETFDLKERVLQLTEDSIKDVMQ